MSGRTLSEFPETLRSPSFEMQAQALAAGYASVRDWALAECILEIHDLKARVAELESGGEIVAD